MTGSGSILGCTGSFWRKQMHKPKVSIVTTTYNDRESLKKTICQIRQQDYDDLEYIIVDGGSADGTLEVIREAKKEF